MFYRCLFINYVSNITLNAKLNVLYETIRTRRNCGLFSLTKGNKLSIFALHNNKLSSMKLLTTYEFICYGKREILPHLCATVLNAIYRIQYIYIYITSMSCDHLTSRPVLLQILCASNQMNLIYFTLVILPAKQEHHPIRQIFLNILLFYQSVSKDQTIEIAYFRFKSRDPPKEFD